MNRTDLIKHVCKETNFKHSDVSKVINIYEQELLNSFADGEDIVLRGFLSISRAKRAPHYAYDFKEGRQFLLDEQTYIKFTPGKNLRNAL